MQRTAGGWPRCPGLPAATISLIIMICLGPKSGYDAARIEVTDEDRLRIVRFAQPALCSAYGGSRVPTPNFDRLAARSVVHDRHYVGSCPACPRGANDDRPAAFLHRSWGPLSRSTMRFRNCCRPGMYIRIWSRIIIIIGKTAVRPITTAMTGTNSSAARSAIDGKPWSSLSGSGCGNSTTPVSSGPKHRNRRAPAGRYQPRVHSGRAIRIFPVGAMLRACVRLPRPQSRCGWVAVIA